MIAFTAALQEDVAANLLVAADMYEQGLRQKDAPLDAYINLAVLYWECLNPGLEKAIPIFHRAGERYIAVLQEAEARFGYKPEVRFWNLYMNFITFGEPPFDDECKLLVLQPDCTLVPYFYLNMSGHPNRWQYRTQVRQLLADCKALPTTKNRYIRSIIEASGLSE